jgi:DNA-binding NtrC family response regulator
MTMVNHAVLVVDDDGLTTSQVAWLLEDGGHRWEAASSVAEALQKLETSSFDAVLLDMYLPDGTGFVVLERALKIDAGPVVLMMTARAEIRSAVDAMRQGAADFIEKPLDLDDLRTRLDRALDTAALRRKLAVYEARDRDNFAPVSQSSAFKKALALADRVASTPSSSALLLGESGVGKEVLASRIHSSSPRRRGPFVRVNLAAIPDSMVEAELFGSVRGAYTDSKRDRAGHFASAEGGTLLLDEIGEFKVELQAKLLRVLESKQFFPVGADRERRTNVRVLAATNRDPHDLIERGLLREDLYYRLATVEIVIPPLRERAEDLMPLADHFLGLFSREFNRTQLRFAPDAIRAIEAYPWPGNVRELRNAIERAVIMSDHGVIEVASLGLVARAPTSLATTPLEITRLDDIERLHILRVLELSGGSRSRAAKLLGLSRSTLWEKLKRFGVE